MRNFAETFHATKSNIYSVILWYSISQETVYYVILLKRLLNENEVVPWFQFLFHIKQHKGVFNQYRASLMEPFRKNSKWFLAVNIFYNNSWRFLVANKFLKRVHLRCLKEFWIRFWPATSYLDTIFGKKCKKSTRINSFSAIFYR